MPVGQHLSNRQHLANAFTAEISAECHSSKSHWRWSKIRTRKKKKKHKCFIWNKQPMVKEGCGCTCTQKQQIKVKWRKKSCISYSRHNFGAEIARKFSAPPHSANLNPQRYKTRAEIIPWFSQAQKFGKRKRCYLLPSLQLRNFKEVDLQLLLTAGHVLTHKVLLQKSEFADM